MHEDDSDYDDDGDYYDTYWIMVIMICTAAGEYGVEATVTLCRARPQCFTRLKFTEMFSGHKHHTLVIV